MAMAAPFFVLFLVSVGLSTQKTCSANTLGFEFHHRFSDRVRKWAESGNWVDGYWPEKGSVEYYAALAAHDRVLQGRRLAGTNPPVTFLEGNETLRISKLGFLHYAIVSVGTPSKSFFVALDTGSDLFWLPCECKSCAPTSSPDYGLGPYANFSIYSPRSSSTSKSIPCNSSYCVRQSQCQAAQSQCPYNVKYLSANTSTTGVLVQDVLHLVTDDSRKKTVEAKIVIGCGQIQTGHFLDSAAPNGLFGLGLEPVSVPSVLSKEGITSNSFSMCFGADGIGRIRFGDRGSSDQAETPFKIDARFPTYIVTVSGIRVGESLFSGTLHAIMDSGTSFTYLTDPAYSLLTKTFDSKVRDQRVSLGANIPFEYCYTLSQESKVPTIGLIMEGGQEFLVLSPVILIPPQEGTYFYCLAVTKSVDFDIIGQNFMTGNKVVFDREKLVLGWKEFDCYDQEKSSNATFEPAVPPSVVVTPRSVDPQETVTKNGTIGVGPESSSPHSLRPYFLGLTLSFLTLIL